MRHHPLLLRPFSDVKDTRSAKLLAYPGEDPALKAFKKTKMGQNRPKKTTGGLKTIKTT